MVEEGRGDYADPSSILRATVMLLNHIGFTDEAKKLQMALDVSGQYEKTMVITGRSDGVTGAEFADYVMKTIQDPKLESKWQRYQ
jgi:isocitrate dehydrogenase (NAD+)